LAIQDFATSGGVCTGTATGCEFSILSHARLTSVTVAGEAQPVTPTGLNTTFEITSIWSVTEKVTGILPIGGQQTLAAFLVEDNQPAFMQVFYDDDPNSRPLTGHGFNDGTLILDSDMVLSQTGTFTVTSDTPVDLDQTGDGNQYPGQETIEGGGGQNGPFAFGNLTQDTSFFKSQLDTFGFAFNNISQVLPFDTVNPSDCFTPSAQAVAVGSDNPTGQCADVHTAGTYAAQGADPNGGYLPVVGGVNGSFPVTALNPDFVAQSDYNSPLSAAAVPVPAPLALIGVGILGLALRRRRAA
jgi:hypothetical protein